jgi:lauroyl/myristoyl acyltransferase
VWCYRQAAPGRYRLVARQVPLPAPTGDRQADVASGMRAVLDALEAAIRQAPGQWFPLSPVWSGLAADRPERV